MSKAKYCVQCAAELEQRIPEGDDRERQVCPACGYVHYVNPKVVVGCIIEEHGNILLCKRSIEPRYGLWTVPAGFLEVGESVADGAARECREEACAEVEIEAPYALMNLTFVSQIYFLFRARLTDGKFAAGDETLETKLVAEEDIPWGDIAFASIKESLRLYFEDRRRGTFPFHMGNIDRR